ncbi:unnamed protein product (macronuclear) [Paramecium tetraurelia]|uniref:Chromosome undetermined scaffold_1, whole genome shotgun sequence n=1 Tax=Paramecium tetraurelia TaxID=5888 RepID=Q6BGI2_PARTE|nr:hypothetical protein [Paramecium tetraurelia strain d4-2]XP_001423478.1 uncharacterized protein GSPATT00000516001 [Paramecium tetraurelia]CAH03238.1 hypothetical protein with coiled-coil domains [Paramecium tetraurelia]CAK56080.1 unnamed protein product [Paramecium tetraurelia]|eukprot:XP_001423478.1 hypothetical protein (macronuclear) [Paramecium tetraurelia strain d4-2]
MKRLTFQTIESEGQQDDFGTSPSKIENWNSQLIKKSRVRTEISIQNTCVVKKQNSIGDFEDEMNAQLQRLKDEIILIKSKLSKQKSAMENLSHKLQKKEDEIELLEEKSTNLAREMSQILSYLTNSQENVIQSQKIQKRYRNEGVQKNSLQTFVDQYMKEYNEQYTELWKHINQKKRERYLLKIENQINIQKKVNLEKDLQKFLMQEKQKKESLLEYLYNQCNISNYGGAAIIDIIRKIKQLNQDFDPSKLPKELDGFERQYLLNKVNFERARKPTITLDESYSQKLKIKNTQSPIKLDYLKKVIGYDAYSFIPILNDNPFKEINKTIKRKRPQRVKSLEYCHYAKKDYSMDSVQFK